VTAGKSSGKTRSGSCQRVDPAILIFLVSRARAGVGLKKPQQEFSD
jgi:hypothetical protein